MAYYFDETYYLNSKLAQLSLTGAKTPSGASWTMPDLVARLKADGLTAQSHYETYGINEGLNPNAYFNEYEYLQAKLKQLHSIDERDKDGKAYTLDTLKQAIKDAGLTAVEHYEKYGAYETGKDGTYINPSNGFDANAYFWTKLAECRASGETVNGHKGSGITMTDLLTAMKASGMSPVTHYAQYGADEAGSYSIAMVQTVPMSQRVANDPGRMSTTDEILPGNYNAATPAPKDGTALSTLSKPGDLGGLVKDSALSFMPVVPDKSPLIPGDTGYKAPPVNIHDVAGNPVFAPTGTDAAKISGNWLVLDAARSLAYIIKADGTILGQISLAVKTNDLSATYDKVFTYTDAALTDSSVHRVEQSDLPSSISVDPALPNNIVDHSGIAVSITAAAITATGQIWQTAGQSSITLTDASGVAAQGLVNGGTLNVAGSVFAANGEVDASGVTGPGKMVINTGAYTKAHSIKGSATADNLVTLGKNAAAYTGGAMDDDITVQGTNTTTSLLLKDTSGSNTLRFGGSGQSITLEGGSDFTGTILGTDNSAYEMLYIDSGTTVRGLVNLGDGRNNMNLLGSMGDYRGGSGVDSVYMDLGTTAGNFDLGGGDDIMEVWLGATVGNINLGADNDELQIHALGGSNPTTLGVVDGGPGTDKVIVEGAGPVTLGGLKGVELLDLTHIANQNVTILSSAGFSNGGTLSITSNGNDVLTFADLTSQAANAGAVSGAGQWFHSGSALTYWDTDAGGGAGGALTVGIVGTATGAGGSLQLTTATP